MIPIRYNLRSLAVRKTTTLATAAGIGLVVFVLAAALMLSAGVKKTLGISGSDDVAIVLRKGSDNELSSGIEEQQVGLIKAMPGVAKGADGEAVGVGEVVVISSMEKVGANGLSNVSLRGIPDNAMAFRPNAKIVAGRPAKVGTDEVIIGAAIRGRFKGVDLDKSFEIKKNRNVTVVGVFEDGGSSYESEVWADVNTLRSAFGREAGVSSVRVKLESPTKYEGFKQAVESDKRLGLMAMTEKEYYEKQSEGLSIFITMLGAIVAICFSFGAMLGAMLTMYTAVANRRREVGTLRALGFSRSAILISFVLEALALSLAGGVMGTLGALALGAVEFSMLNFASFSEVVFRFYPTPEVLGTALAAAGVMGLIGGIFPAVRAARTNPVVAMRGG
jgi:putative ABC transport system permease protein